MKNIFIISLLAFLLVLSGCAKNSAAPAAEQAVGDAKGSYLGSDHQGNYVWGGAMNLAWNELNDNVLHDKLKLNSNDNTVLAMVEKLNNPVITKNDLDEASYYVKSGYGQVTVDVINTESRKKFPDNSFGDLQLQLGPKDIISYAYFLKKVEYEAVFKKKNVDFAGKSVNGFSADETSRSNVRIMKYDSDNKFIIALSLKEKNDQLILAKGYEMSDPKKVVEEIAKYNKYPSSKIGENDIFEAPMLKLDIRRDYQELTNKYLANQGFEEYVISAMLENIKFDMDEKGARVENRSFMNASFGSMPVEDKQKIKKFILNKPYWVVMKRGNSANPYFILGVKNTALMTRE